MPGISSIFPKTPVTPATTKPKIVVAIAMTSVRTISPRSPGMSMLLLEVPTQQEDQNAENDCDQKAEQIARRRVEKTAGHNQNAEH
jgi:hypothetical protein